MLSRLNIVGRRYLSTTLYRSYPVKQFKLSDIGEGITECEILSWTIKPNDKVGLFDPLCEVQSDKASVELTSPYEGTIKELFYKEGDVAKVGDALCSIDVPDDVSSVGIPPVEAKAAPTPEPTPEPTKTTRQKHPLDPSSPPETSGSSTRESHILATPSARHMARTSGVDLAKLHPGSGKNGRIEKSDIQAFIDGSSQTDSPPPQPSVESGNVNIELGRTRYGMWKAMTKSLEIPVFGYSTMLDLTTIHGILPTLNSNIPSYYLPPSSKPTRPLLVDSSSLYPAPGPPELTPSHHYTRLRYLPFLLKTLSKAMHEWPLFRSSITPSPSGSKPTLTIRPSTDITLALSTPTGLYTPTLSRVSAQSMYALAGTLSDLSNRARQKPCGLTAKETQSNGTISVSNVGAIGDGHFAAPVLVPSGGIAIVAIGRAHWIWDVSPHINNGNGEKRLKVGISWSADHRVVEGAEMAAFCETWRGYVEAPERMIAEGI